MSARRRAPAIRPDRVSRSHNIIRVLAAALLAAGALAVAACGGDDSSGGNSSGGNSSGGASSAGDRESKARDAQLKYARCMRENGVDMPDPTFDAGGGTLQTGPGEEVPPAKLREAEQACEKYLEEIEPPKLSEEQQQEMRDAALAQARCMREQGIENFPDPTFGKDGGAEIRIEKGSGIDPSDPDFKQAEEACRDKAPKLPSEESAP
jgi:hypothetical protein